MASTDCTFAERDPYITANERQASGSRERGSARRLRRAARSVIARVREIPEKNFFPFRSFSPFLGQGRSFEREREISRSAISSDRVGAANMSSAALARDMWIVELGLAVNDCSERNRVERKRNDDAPSRRTRHVFAMRTHLNRGILTCCSAATAARNTPWFSLNFPPRSSAVERSRVSR